MNSTSLKQRHTHTHICHLNNSLVHVTQCLSGQPPILPTDVAQVCVYLRARRAQSRLDTFPIVHIDSTSPRLPHPPKPPTRVTASVHNQTLCTPKFASSLTVINQHQRTDRIYCSRRPPRRRGRRTSRNGSRSSRSTWARRRRRRRRRSCSLR